MPKRVDGVRQRHRKTCTRKGACDCPWQATVGGGPHPRLQRSFPRHAEAVSWRRDAQRALEAGVLQAPVDVTVADALDELLEGMRTGVVLDRSGDPYKPATIRSYETAVRRYIVPALGRLKLSDVRRRDVQDLVDGLRARGLAASTVHNKLDPIRVLFRRAKQRDLIFVDPTDGLELPAVRHKRRTAAPRDRARQLVAAVPEHYRALWACLFFAGLRIGEARALRWDDVDLKAGLIHVTRNWDDVEGEVDPKSYAGTRDVPLAGVLRQRMRAHKLATGRGGQDLVFGRGRDQAFVRSTIRKHARDAWAQAGLEPLTPHEARHSAASYLIAAGIPDMELQAYIGHSDIRTTKNVYGHLFPGAEQAAAARLDDYLDGPGVSQSGSQ